MASPSGKVFPLEERQRYRRECERRRSLGLFARPSELQVSDAACRELGGSPERDRDRKIVGWLFPSEAALQRARGSLFADASAPPLAAPSPSVRSSPLQEDLDEVPTPPPCPPEATRFWERLAPRLRDRLAGSSSYTLYLEPLACVGVSPHELSLWAPNRFVAERVRESYQAVITQEASQLLGQPIEVRLLDEAAQAQEVSA